MDFGFTRALRTELNDVEGMFKRSLLPWWGDIQVYLNSIASDPTWMVLPSIVLSSYKYMGVEREFSKSMTNIFKTIYLAIYIHERVKDDDEGQAYNKEMQFSILIGDYIFGRMLKLLIEAEAEQLLPIFSNMICEINEGLVNKHKMGIDYEESLLQTRGPLYKAVYRTAAVSAQKDEEDQIMIAKMGYHLGMAIEMLNYRLSNHKALRHLAESYESFRIYKQFNTIQDTVIEEVYRELREIISHQSKLAVV